MKSLPFYRTISEKQPVEDHLGSLSGAQATKIARVLKSGRETKKRLNLIV